ncbi:hypothetical protein CDAR_497181 [Caerostris darwini]|uniref:Uncharacterized protein n=1 Tax=Caerostris darwini TaxID=1538125 RepID=A0AAV4S054_9ARAC|nr:hypothetical protein CDAR_497181 [Caerostris darwini]
MAGTKDAMLQTNSVLQFLRKEFFFIFSVRLFRLFPHPLQVATEHRKEPINKRCCWISETASAEFNIRCKVSGVLSKSSWRFDSPELTPAPGLFVAPRPQAQWNPNI